MWNKVSLCYASVRAGYTIPLDKRLAADGRGLQETQINDNFAKLSEALYVAEQKVSPLQLSCGHTEFIFLAFQRNSIRLGC